MATLKLVSYKEQNAQTLAGVQVTSATYAGVNTAVDLAVKVGVQAPVISIVGTQTASRIYIGLDTANATHGAQVVIKRRMATPGTSVVSVFSGLAGTGYATTTALYTGTGGDLDMNFAFDGVAGVWR